MIKKKIWKIRKKLLPQHTDHEGVMWHGTYFNWLEEGRIDALSNAGIEYNDLSSKGYELPVINANIRYLRPIHHGDEIIIETIFNINKSPRLNINSRFISNSEELLTLADIKLVLIEKNNFKIVKNRPVFISEAFKKLI